MTQLEVLQQDLAVLVERVNCAMILTDGSVILTKRQLRAFANAIQSQTIEKIKNEISDMNIYAEDEVSIELSGLELEVTVDNDKILDIVCEGISDGDEVTDEDVQTYLNALEK